MLELGHNFLQWFKRSHFLYVFGFFIYFKPLEPFYYEAIISKNITQEQYSQSIHPVSAFTYFVAAYFIFLLIFFDLCNYVFAITCTGGLVMSIFMWQSGQKTGILDVLFQVQVVEGFYGCVVATEIIYYASIYICQEGKKDFAQLTATIRAIPLLARMVSGITAQILVTKGWMDYGMLAFLSLPACVHAILLLLHLPPLSELKNPPALCLDKITWIKAKFKEAFLRPHVFKFSAWMAFTMCGYARVSSIMQPFWREAQEETDELPNNGAIEGISAFLSVLAILLTGTLSTKWKRENLFLCVVSILQSALLLGLANIEHKWDSTIIYLVQEIVYYFSTAMVSATIAEKVFDLGCVGVVFGTIGFISAAFKGIFVWVTTAVVLTFQQEFLVYCVYHLAVAAIMILFCLLKL